MRANEDDAREGWNAADQSQTHSNAHPGAHERVLAFYKRAIQMRKAHDVLVRPVPIFMRTHSRRPLFFRTAHTYIYIYRRTATLRCGSRRTIA